jgi:hypothetical protein
MAQE